uniref:Uncharacterized protein n=1 Tax=Vitis vinifera TaxID=29760 RepID=F6HMS2_VITVI
MAIKVLSKKIVGTRVVSGSVCVVTGFVTRNNWFNATSNLGFQRSFVTITLREQFAKEVVLERKHNQGMRERIKEFSM